MARLSFFFGASSVALNFTLSRLLFNEQALKQRAFLELNAQMSSYNAAEMMSAEAEKRFDEMYGGKVPNIAPRKKKDGGQRERIAELEVVNQELDARLYVIFLFLMGAKLYIY